MKKKTTKNVSHNKNLTIGKLNDKIDSLILAGKTNTREWQNLTRLHYQLTRS